MRRLALCAALALASACGDNRLPSAGPKDGGPQPPDAMGDAGTTPLGPCLDQPTDLPRPPTGALPCELVPPGLKR